MKTINNELIRSFRPCYDPSKKGIPDNETLTVLDWVEKYRAVVPARDIVWLLCRRYFLSDRDLRLFAVFCAREALKMVGNPDLRSIDACDVAERFANGEATMEELNAAAYYAYTASANSAGAAIVYATHADAYAAAYASVAYADAYAAYADADDDYDVYADAYAAAREQQLNKLLTYFLHE